MKILSSRKDSLSYREISDDEFDQQIIKNGLAAVVTLTKVGMRGAAMMHTIMEGLCKEYNERIAFYYIHPEKSKLTEVYGLYDLAAVFFFCKGEMLDHQIGLVSKPKLRDKIEQFLQLIK